MKQFLAALLLAAAVLSPAAQQPVQCVNPQSLNGLMFLGRSDQKMEITRTLPASLGNVRVPRELTLIGTGVRARDTVVAWKSSASTTTASYDAIISALDVAGWKAEDLPGSRPVFQAEGGRQVGTVCRDGERRVVTAFEMSGSRYVNVLMMSAAERSRACNVQASAPASFGGLGGLFPRLQYPAGTTRAMGGGGGGGGSDVSEFSERVISQATMPALRDHLETQLRAQGWTPAANWSGAGSAGSTWNLVVDGRPGLVALEILRVAPDTYQVDMTVMMGPG